LHILLFNSSAKFHAKIRMHYCQKSHRGGYVHPVYKLGYFNPLSGHYTEQQ